MKLFAYHVSPIDFWTGATHLQDYIQNIWDEGSGDWDESNRNPISSWNNDRLQACREIEEVLTFFKAAQEAAKTVKWEGDIIEGPYIKQSIGEGTLELSGFMWKQSNNGSTFIVSRTPVSLPEGYEPFEQSQVDIEPSSLT